MKTQNTGIALAMEIKEACQESITDLEVMMNAAEFVKETGLIADEDTLCLLYKYSVILASTVATKIISMTVSESEIKGMISDIEVFENIKEEVLGESN